MFIMIGSISALGQLGQDPEIIPTPLDATCIDLDDPLNPVPGNPYTYEVAVPEPAGVKEFHWFVTQDINFLSPTGLTSAREAEGGSILASGSAHYDTPTQDANTITLTWQSFVLDPTEYVFVVVYVENTTSTDPTCTTNNLKVYRIRPAHAFTLDIANLSSDGTANASADHEQCVDDVQSAVFDPALNAPEGGVVYDFGTNTFYYVVAAANFSGQYLLYAQFTGLQAATPNGSTGQTATLYWGYSIAGVEASGAIPVTEGATLDLGQVDVQNSDGFVGQDGEFIYIKVVIEHNSFEAADAPSYTYSLAINGKLADAAGAPLAADDSFDDLHHANCNPDLFTNDIANQVLLQRPEVNAIDPTPFLPIEE